MSKHVPIPKRERACAGCGATFLTHAANKLHCSVECRVREAAAGFSGDGCWEWPRSRNKASGYGQLSSYEGGRHVLHAAHVVAHRAFLGPTKGLFVCHRCDNPPCFNPRHLFLGTVLDNARDAQQKGRLANRRRSEAPHWTAVKPERIPRGTSHHLARDSSCLPRGGKHHNAKLTEDDVRAIRSSSETLTALAARLGVSVSLVSGVKRGKTWRHVT